MKFDVFNYASSVFAAARKRKAFSETQEINFVSQVGKDIGERNISPLTGWRIIHGLVLMLFSKQNPKRPVK